MEAKLQSVSKESLTFKSQLSKPELQELVTALPDNCLLDWPEAEEQEVPDATAEVAQEEDGACTC